jgi:hypothetical protein
MNSTPEMTFGRVGLQGRQLGLSEPGIVDNGEFETWHTQLDNTKAKVRFY